MQPIGLYIHVPFCGSKCAYCDFYSRVRQDQRAAYLDALENEIHAYAARGLAADTVFFGGGTPSLLTPEEVGRILTALRESFALSDGAEVTMEANPETVDLPYLSAVRRLGVNRISFGVQSAQDEELHALGRKHTFARAVQAVGDARAAGFDNISLDLMLGIPYQTAETLDDTLKKVLALSPEHLSCYLLQIEEGTPFYRRHIETLCASEDETADMLLRVSDTLRGAGYAHYEISNFALPGRESRHNRKYWQDLPYLGFGPSAHSCLDGRRFFNPASLDRYIAQRGLCAESETDEPAGTASERLMLGLRLQEGVCLSALEALCSFPPSEQDAFLKRCAPYARAGLLTVTGDRVALTERGMLVSNMLLSEILPD
jgi:oxygen-independent coproporphyrinogen-3 oxidase